VPQEFYRHNRRARSAAETRFLARGGDWQQLCGRVAERAAHARAVEPDTTRTAQAGPPLQRAAAYPIDNGASLPAAAGESRPAYRLDERAVPVQYLAGLDNIDLEVEPGVYDLTFLTRPGNAPPITRRVTLQPGARILVPTS
jgi:hypothetical protein